MAEEVKVLNKILLGDTTVEAVEKVNEAIDQTNANTVGVKANADNVSTLSGTVATNSSAINNLTGQVNNIINTTIPAVEKSVDDLQNYSDDTFATKEALGKLAGGMRYKGTVNATTKLPDGTEAEPVENGDTYKVTEYGKYNPSNPDEIADVGDLYIAAVTVTTSTGEDGTPVETKTITWTLVPSGDDGDVYADNDFSVNEEIIVADRPEGSSTGKKIKSSGKTIYNEDFYNGVTLTTDNMTEFSKKIPTVYAVKKSITNIGSIAIVPMWNGSMNNETGVWTYTVSKADKPKKYEMLRHTYPDKVVNVNAGSKPIIADISCDEDVSNNIYTLTVKVDPSKVNTFKNGCVVYLSRESENGRLSALWD